MATRHLSTTALARRIGKDSKELFILLAQGGWMLKVDNQWQLTEKGKFEGGIYVNHPKYGDYIAWPESTVDHPLLSLLPEAPLSASALGNKWQLSARLVNLLLRDLGLLDAFVHGWKLTALGRQWGGEQHEAEHTGIPFATWPESLLDNAILLKRIEALKGLDANRFVFDEHPVTSALQQRIDNWLYLTRTLHGTNAVIEVDGSSLMVDFYLPQWRLVLMLWPEIDSRVTAPTSASPSSELSHSMQSPAANLQKKLDVLSVLQSNHVDVLEMHESSLEALDELLSRELLRRGHAVY